MAKQKKPVHRVQMTEGKRNIIHQLLEEYDIQTAEDTQDALKDLLGGTIKEMMETSEGFISDVTDKILPQIEDWQNRPLDKEVLTIQVGDNESSKYWLSVLNELKNRGVKDILILCADGLTGIKEAIAAAFPKTEYQRCIVHQVRNPLKYVPDKDRKAFATDLKIIYQAPDEKKSLAALDRVTEKWTLKYPNSMKRWKDNRDAISPIFISSSTVPIPAIPKFSTKTFATLGLRNAGSVGPRWIFFTPRYKSASRTITAFCSYHAIL